MNRFSRVIQLLFPFSGIFNFFENLLIKKFIKALAILPEDIKQETQKVYMDLFPDSTRAFDLWTRQFGIVFFDTMDSSYISLLKAMWMGSVGGQGLSYLDKILKNIDTRINIIENIPLKNPRDSNSVIKAVCAFRAMRCGNGKAVASYRVGDASFAPTVIINNSEGLYNIPNDERFWSTCIYIGGSVIRNNIGKILYITKIEIDKKWKQYIEYIVLKIKPAHITMVLYIKYV